MQREQIDWHRSFGVVDARLFGAEIDMLNLLYDFELGWENEGDVRHTMSRCA
jgi:hypothetical protein